VKHLKKKNLHYKKREKDVIKTMGEMKALFGAIADIVPSKKRRSHSNTSIINVF